MALALAPFMVSANSQLLRLCKASHNRKAWLFSDTPKGTQASAIHYSLIETAKANGLEPYAYLTQVLKALPYADTVEKIEALSWNFKNPNLAG